MAGAHFLPEYYKDKINLAVFLAPPASMKYNSNKIIKAVAHELIRDFTCEILDVIKVWNLIPYDFKFSEVNVKICELFDGKICELLMKSAFDNDPNIDD